MALIHFYSHLNSEHKTEIANGVLKNLYPEIDWENRLILVSGQKVDCNYNAKEKDIIFIREVPTEPTTILICMGVAAVICGVVIGVQLYNDYQQELEDAQKNSFSKDSNIDSLPFCKGANNQGASGRAFPLILGNMYFTPYRLCPKYYTVSGNNGVNQYVWQVLEVGLNPLFINSISLGNVKIYENTSNVPQNGVFSFIKDGTYYDDENLIEIRQSGDFTNQEFNKKISSNFVNSEISHDFGKDAEPLVIQLAENAKAMDICILFDGLREWNSENGTYKPRTVIVNAYWSNKDNPNVNNASDWNELTGNERFLQLSKKTPVKRTFSNLVSTISFSKKSDIGTKLQRACATKFYDDFKPYITISNDRPYENLTITNVSYKIDSSFSTSSRSEKIKFTITYSFDVIEYEYVKSYSNEFSYNSAVQMRFIAHKDFTPEQSFGKQITIKLVRQNPKTENNSAKESVYLNFVNTEIFDIQKTKALIDSETSLPTELVSCKPLEDKPRDMCTRIAIKMKANKNNENLSDSINVIASACARIWQTSTETDESTGLTVSSKFWTEEEFPTRNPAAWALHILTCKHHDKSQFADDELDLQSFGAWYEYCEENELYCDGVITSGKTKQSLLDDIFTLGNACLVLNINGKYEVFIDKKEDYSVALLNTQDISDITISKEFKRKANGRKITFVNRETWVSESVYYMKNGTAEHSSDDTITEIAPQFITDYNHAIKFAHRQIVQDYLQPKEITATVGNEGAYYPLYSCVDVQLPHLSVGIKSAVVKSANYKNELLESIVISEKVYFETSKSYGIILQVQTSQGRSILNVQVQGKGATNVLTLKTPTSTPYPVQSGNILSFGELDADGNFTLVRSKMKIVGISRADNGYKLKLKDYAESLYTIGSIPDYVSNATKRNNNSVANNPDYQETPEVLNGEKGEKGDPGADGKDGEDYRYTLDISPEAQSVSVDEDKNLLLSEVEISAYFYDKENLITDNITYKAIIETDKQYEVGTWNGNVLTLSTSYLKNDVLYVVIKATYTKDGTEITRQVKAQISKIYGIGTNIYKMLFPDGEKIKVDNSGAVVEPEQLRAEKRVVSKNEENPTDYGKITLEVLPNGNEENFNPYSQIGSSENYLTTKKYYIKANAFLLKLADDIILAESENVGALFFSEVDL